MSKKTLKEMIAEAGHSDNFTCTLCRELVGDYEHNCKPRDGKNPPKGCLETLGEMLADAIDREYLERPKFENGEVVKIGDELYSGYYRLKDSIERISIHADGSFRIETACGCVCCYEPDERVKLPELLGADGKPIRVGYTVWLVEEARSINAISGVLTPVGELKVIGFSDSRRVVKTTGLCGDPEFLWAQAEYLTHEQPDSLERIEDDAHKSPVDYWGCKYCMSCSKECPVLIDGKTPRDHYGAVNCREAMALDLLKRQRKVLEREKR